MKTVMSMIAISLLLSPAAIAKPVVYQYPAPQIQAKPMLTISKQSNEYWQRVTGKELKAGVALHITQADNLVRVAPKAHFQAGQVEKARGLDLNLLSLHGSAKGKALAVQRIASQQQMRQAGFEDGSVAMKAPLEAHILKTSQPLRDDDEYLVHVKEKGSPLVLDAKADFRVHPGQQKLALALAMQGQALPAKGVKLTLVSPDGDKVPVHYDGQNVTFDTPLQAVGARHGYYQLNVFSESTVNGQTVARSATLPFMQTEQTATLGSSHLETASDGSVVAKVPLLAQQPGRFAIKATLVSVQGKQKVALATTEVAQQVDADAVFSLPFKVSGQDLSHYQLDDLVITDQTRMLKLYPDVK
ncbi:DUF4785 domain-containing protein [Gallaecimonas sp. GXIMD1310]|uniref:DUF4785 domain-containing protein n=1 Tax=Gallaecimonas sp. GXIMD1310 TaxID=3131926 RepID=UPI003245C9A9